MVLRFLCVMFRSGTTSPNRGIRLKKFVALSMLGSLMQYAAGFQPISSRTLDDLKTSDKYVICSTSLRYHDLEGQISSTYLQRRTASDGARRKSAGMASGPHGAHWCTWYKHLWLGNQSSVYGCNTAKSCTSTCNIMQSHFNLYIYICIIMYVYIIFNYANIGQDTADPCCDQEEMRMGACRSGEREVVVAEASGWSWKKHW